MSKSRIALVAALFLAPWVFLIGVGSYHLWDRGWWFWAWWPMFLTFGLGYFLAYRWTRGKGLLPDTDHPPPNYWTDRDKAAWGLVQQKAKGYEQVSAEELGNPRHYTDIALDLAEQVAAIYAPGGDSPLDHLTIPEILACVELAAADLDELVQKYLPGSHLLRVRDYKRARQAADWYRYGQNAYWAGATILNPVEGGLRWLAARYGLGNLFEKLQGNVLLWVHTAYVHQLGHYLIEMNSGRLKVGVKRYRELIAAHQAPPVQADLAPPVETAPVGAAPTTPAASPVPPAAIPRTGIAVLGPVKAGKSSLVNALLGQQAATVDTLPVPHVGVRYNLTLAGGAPITVLDTAGYGQEGANEAEFDAAVRASQEADLILFVTPATNPGRRADVDLLDRLRAWFAERPHLKLPPVVAVVNQIDLLSPKAEWAPPYHWQTGTRPKEANIRDCVAAVREQLGSRVIDVAPVCARGGDAFGITEYLVPAVAAQLEDARGAAVLRAFHAEAAADQWKKVGQQVLEGGKKALGILWENLKKPQ
jgi:predicted GTPase